MKQIAINDLDDAPLFISKCYKRVTQKMIHCPVRIVSRSQLQQPTSLDDFGKLPWDRYEREAKHYYQSKGLKVIRLEHFASTGVGLKEDIFPESKILGDHFRKYLPSNAYTKFITKTKAAKEAIALNSVNPKDYSLSFYPPDFLVVDTSNGNWKFVEVKGPTDKLRFRQANWYVNLLPSEWEYEIFASINKEFEEGYLCNISTAREAANFKNEFLIKSKEVDEWNAMMVKNKKRK